MRVFIIFLSGCLMSWQLSVQNGGRIIRKDALSEFGFFKMPLAELNPESGVIAYNVNMPLFSNYAEKARFMRVPNGTKAEFEDSAVFNFPVGTVLIKNFYYQDDLRKPDGKRKIIETRLLVHQPEGWDAWPYLWNEEQTEAFYDPAGETTMISYIGDNGKKRTIAYAVPNKNQCKGCHVKNNKLLPIGMTARQLNGDFVLNGRIQNQLGLWESLNVLDGLPDLESIPSLARMSDDMEVNLNIRARSYLDANCGHCHSADGPASTSGLFLDFFEQRRAHLGVNKTPVAAGRGSGNLNYDIVPGKPEQSIMVFRMKTNDPAIAMPELGREQVHSEGVALIEEWIRKSSFQ